MNASTTSWDCDDIQRLRRAVLMSALTSSISEVDGEVFVPMTAAPPNLVAFPKTVKIWMGLIGQRSLRRLVIQNGGFSFVLVWDARSYFSSADTPRIVKRTSFHSQQPFKGPHTMWPCCELGKSVPLEIQQNPKGAPPSEVRLKQMLEVGPVSTQEVLSVDP
mmetsp:Transcript_13082/g.52031  ORF Transcript_13082/g.52031 Transcript_13082/m.52031 type:complete len:162 (-) Transcript_13082:4588-5073(-)